MAQDLSREEQRRGSRQLILWGIALAVVVGCGLTLLSYYLSVSPGQSTTDATGPRTFQNQGESIAGATTKPSQRDTEAFGARGRSRDIISSETENVDLSPAQSKALNNYFRQHAGQGSGQVDFTIAIGTAVPRQQALTDWPQELADVIPKYRDDQYLFAGNRVVVVEKGTRRVIAIIPISA